MASPTSSKGRRFSLPALLTAISPSHDPARLEPRRPTTPESGPASPTRAGFHKRVRRRSRLSLGGIFGSSEDLEFGCGGEERTMVDMTGEDRTSTPLDYSSPVAYSYSTSSYTRRSSASSTAPSLTHSRAASSSSRLSTYSEASTCPSSLSSSPLASPMSACFPSSISRSPRAALLSEEKRKRDEMAAIEAMNDYFSKVKLSSVEEDCTVLLDSHYERELVNVGALEISYLSSGSGISSTFTPSSVEADFSYDNSHAEVYCSAPRASSHLSVVSSTSTLRPGSVDSNATPVSSPTLLDVYSELDLLSDYFASPLHSPLSTPAHSPTRSRSASTVKPHVPVVTVITPAPRTQSSTPVIDASRPRLYAWI